MFAILILIALIIGLVIGCALALAFLDEQYSAEKREVESWRQKFIDSHKNAEVLRRDLQHLTQAYGDLLERSQTTFAEVA